MEAQQPTAVWFRTHLSLGEVSALFDTPVDDWDGENHWEWVDLDFADIGINISRTHTVPPEQTETRIARRGYPTWEYEFPQDALRQIVAALQRAGVDPIHTGKVECPQGNDLIFTVHEKITAPAPPPGR
ncbi:hypothetical protein ACGFYY_21330 [Streptomyces sp. NPDC048331]|uniref:hypothetical protein n=1 Tax=Streptomyces sp. NPDC048331 TaxID=3365534 RepID=UPI0037223ECE